MVEALPVLLRAVHKKECKQKAQQQLRVNVSSTPPGGASGRSNSWVGVSQSDVARWASGQMIGRNKGSYPQPKSMSGNVDVKHEKLFDVKIQVPGYAQAIMHTQPGLWLVYVLLLHAP
jgi:hypothetical protein